MKTTAYKFITISTFVLVAAVSGSYGQEYFNKISTPSELYPVVPPSEQTPDQTNPADRVDISQPGLPPEASGEDKYNMALGPIHFSFAAGVGLEYNDNVNLGDRGHEISDMAVRPSLTVDATYQLSEMNTLHFSIGASYAKYFNHSEFDTRGVLLSPNSVLALTMHVGDVALTFRDRFSYQEDPFDEPTLSGVAVYRRMENQVGVQADWSFNESFKITGGYDHYNLWTFDDAFSSLDRSIETIYIRPSYAITPSVKVGVNASGSLIDFKENIQNDGKSFMVGPFAEIALSENTHVYAEAGYQAFTFDNNGSINDSGDSKTWYARVDVSNRLTESFSQRLNFSKSAEVGFGSNFYDLYHVEYAADWRITENITLDPSIFYEHYETSAPAGFLGEDANRYGASIGLRYILSPSITLGLDYRYIYKNSSLAGLDYRQNLVLLSLYYNF